MITNLLTSIKEQLEELNYQLKDNNYLQELEKKINVVNENINRTYHENTKLHSIIKEVREYILNNRDSDSFTELTSGKETDIEYCIPVFEDILEILDKEGNSNE